MNQPSKSELLATDARGFDTDRLTFTGPRGDRSRHLSREALEAGMLALPAAPKDRGRVVLLLARGPAGERETPARAELTVEGGMPGDRWVDSETQGPEAQLATMQRDYAELVANGQSLALHGDNLIFDLDLSVRNLPVGSRLRAGSVLFEVTEKPHNGCKKWAQRFGLAAMQLHMDPEHRARNLRGIYLRVVESGTVAVGDEVEVVVRGT